MKICKNNAGCSKKFNILFIHRRLKNLFERGKGVHAHTIPVWPFAYGLGILFLISLLINSLFSSSLKCKHLGSFMWFQLPYTHSNTLAFNYFPFISKCSFENSILQFKFLSGRTGKIPHKKIFISRKRIVLQKTREKVTRITTILL